MTVPGTPDNSIPRPTVDDDIAEWIDAHDPVPGASTVDAVLAEQRAEHEPGPDGPDVVDDAIGALVNNTGHDGGAATG